MSKRPRGSDSIDSGPTSTRAPLPCDQAPSVTDEARAILANCHASQWSLPAGALAAPATTSVKSVAPPHDTTAPQANRPRAIAAPHTTRSITVGFTGARDGMTPPQAASMERWLAHLEATSCGVPSHALPGLSQTAQEQQESDQPDNTGHTVAATDALPPTGTAAAPATPNTKPQRAIAPTSTGVLFSGNDEKAATEPRHLHSSSPRKPASLLLLHGQCIGADAEVHAMAAARSERWRIGLLPSNLAASTATHCAASPTAVAMAAPAAPLKRNKSIVDRSCVVLAAPPSEFEVLRSGSWSTIRYTAKARRPLVLVLPSGAVKVMARGWCPELMADA